MKLNNSKLSPNLALHDSDQLLNIVFNQQFQFMVILSPEGRVLEINDLALKAQGSSREDCIGKFFWKIPAWFSLPEWEDIWQQRLIQASTQEGPAITEDCFQVSDGSVHYADISTMALYTPDNGKLSGYIIQIIDRTKDHLIKNRIQENEARLTFVLEHSCIGTWELDLSNHTSNRSLRHDQIFGYNSLLPEWTYEMFIEHVVPEDQNGIAKKFLAAINNKTDWNFKCRIRRKDGEIRWISASGGHVFDTTGQVGVMAGIVQDITNQELAEVDKSYHSAELESVFKALPDIYFRMTPDGIIVDYQAHNLNELIIKPEDFLGKRMQDILPEHLGKLFQSKIDEINQTENMLVFTYEVLVNNEVAYFDARLNRVDINGQLICIIRNVTDEFKAKKSLAVSEQQLRTIFEQAAVGVALVNSDNGQFIRINQRFCNMLGYSVDEMLKGKTFKDITHVDDLPMTLIHHNKIVSGQQYESTIQKRYLHKDGHIVWAELSVSPTWKVGQKSQIHTLVVVVHDISERKRIEDKLKLSANVFTHAGEGIIITDAQRRIIDVNTTFTTLTGYSRAEAIGQNPSFLNSGRQTANFYNDIWQVLLEKGGWSGEIWNSKKNGEVYVEMLNISSVKDSRGKISNYVGLFTDITLMKEHQGKLEHIAHYDLLTNLPNRVFLADRLSQAMLQCNRHEQSLAVVFLDLDGFKAVNDIHGHDVGDKLLIALSAHMKEALREGDSLARIGGDEFVAILTDLTTVEDCEPVLKRLLLAASKPVMIDEAIFNLSASLGVTLYPQDNVDGDLLMRHADQAMYMAKDQGKNCYHLFDTAQDDAVKLQRESLEAIRRALDNHQFLLYYQPKVNMRTGTVIGVEALIRWQHPERGLLNPLDFLPALENNPMSIEMGEWVIEAALLQISQWQQVALNLPMSISVNIAAVQLQQPNFTQRLTTLLSAYPDVDPRYLELEVLETSALNDVQHVSKIMDACMALGVKFSLDDFGTGYSSLTYLRRLPVSLIKIDQSFVRDMLHDEDDLAIVEGVIALAKSFKRDVIAEGVETIEHGTMLLQLGCELAQGYGIAGPMSASNIIKWIANWKPDVNWQV